MTNSGRMGRKWEKAIVGLLTQPTLLKAAAFAGISENTLLRWLQVEEFSRQYSAAKREALKQAVAQLQQACSEAVAALRQVCSDLEANPASRVSAAKAILDMSVKMYEMEEIEKRVEELEKIAKKG